MDTRKRSINVLMLPWLAHGHISPFVELAKRLSTRNFTIQVCSSKVNIDSSIKPKLSPKESESIKLVELPVPCTQQLPPQLHTTNCLPPHLMSPLKRAFDDSRREFSNILETLKPDLVIYDFIQPWAPEEAARHDIPAVLFLSTGAAAASLLMYRGFDPDLEYPFADSVYFRESERGVADPKDSERTTDCLKRSRGVVLIKTFDELEGKYVDFLTRVIRKKFLPVGPLVQRLASEEKEQGDDVIEWLDRLSGIPRSTVFASFGSEYFLSENEIEAIANGLERSGLSYLWVVRFPKSDKKVKVEEKLPLGFLERTAKRGKVVEGWAPQKRILSHPSVGGFMSHCGWSSIMESLYYGVPIIVVPMHLDQPLNARLVVEVGCGEEVVRSREGILDGEEVARVSKRVVSDEALRKRVAEMSEMMKESNGEKEIDGVVRELELLLCGKRNKGTAAKDSMNEEFIDVMNLVSNNNHGEALLSGTGA